MTSETYSRLRELFLHAADLGADEQRRLLDAIGTDDPVLAQRLKALLGLDQELAASTVRPALELLRPSRGSDDDGGAVGLHIGAFVLREVIGSGGMGKVYLADRDDGSVRQRAAVKLVRSELLDEPLRRRFHFERRALASLEHRDIARLIDAGELADGTPYLIMEFVEGEPITVYADRLRLGLGERLRLFLDVCDAVAHAHRKLIVHRDLKPSNVFVAADGAIKLLDFGIAKALPDLGRLDEAGERTATANRFWSPRYAAPELLRGDETGVACDVYGLGILLYELTSGLLPFDFAGLRPGEVENTILSGARPLPSERLSTSDAAAAIAVQRRLAGGAALIRALRGDLDSIAEKCLRVDPAARYRSVDALSDEVRAYLDERPVRARRGRALYVTRKFVARHRIATAAAAVVLATLTLSATALWWQYRRTQHESARAQQTTAVLLDAFNAADAAGAPGTDITAAQILQQAALRVKNDATLQPALKGELLLTIADAQSNGNYADAALDSLRAADAAFEAAGIVDTATQLRLLDSEARAQLCGERFDAFDATYARATTLPLTPVQRLNFDQMRAWAMFGRTEYNAAQLQFDAVAADARRLLVPGDKLAYLIRFRQAASYNAIGGIAQALTMLRALETDQRRTLGPDDPALIPVLREIGHALRRLDRKDEALANAHEIVASSRRLYGPESMTYLSARSVLAIVLGDDGKWAESYAIDQEDLPLLLRKFGESHATVARAYSRLAGSSEQLPQHRHEADAFSAKAVVAAERVWPEGNLRRFVFRANRCLTLTDLGRYAQAAEAMRPALAEAARFEQLKQYDSYPIGQLCLATADYGDGASEARLKTLRHWLADASQEGVLGVEAQQGLDTLVGVLKRLGVDGLPAAAAPR